MATGNSIGTPLEGFGLQDRDWTEKQWHALLHFLVEKGFGSWKQVAGLVLGHLNPSQVGTSLASSEGFKRRYGKGNTMRIVMEWFYSQAGRCVDCDTRLELQADHAQPREEFADPLDADFIENMVLRCRRCNVIRRPSHELGGRTFLTAEAALMWILLVIRPRTRQDFIRLCRLYGMTMADIRMQEAWAMAHWLANSTPPQYEFDCGGQPQNDVLCWPDNALTRRPAGMFLDGDPPPLYQDVDQSDVIGFVVNDSEERSLLFYQMPVSSLPYSVYDLGTRPRNDLAFVYIPPDRAAKIPPALQPLQPRGTELIAIELRNNGQSFYLGIEYSGRRTVTKTVPPLGKCERIPLGPDAMKRVRIQISPR